MAGGGGGVINQAMQGAQASTGSQGMGNPYAQSGTPVGQTPQRTQQPYSFGQQVNGIANNDFNPSQQQYQPGGGYGMNQGYGSPFGGFGQQAPGFAQPYMNNMLGGGAQNQGMGSYGSPFGGFGRMGGMQQPMNPYTQMGGFGSQFGGGFGQQGGMGGFGSQFGGGFGQQGNMGGFGDRGQMGFGGDPRLPNPMQNARIQSAYNNYLNRSGGPGNGMSYQEFVNANGQVPNPQPDPYAANPSNLGSLGTNMQQPNQMVSDMQYRPQMDQMRMQQALQQARLFGGNQGFPNPRSLPQRQGPAPSFGQLSGLAALLQGRRMNKGGKVDE